MQAALAEGESGDDAALRSLAALTEAFAELELRVQRLEAGPGGS